MIRGCEMPGGDKFIISFKLKLPRRDRMHKDVEVLAISHEHIKSQAARIWRETIRVGHQGLVFQLSFM